MKRVLILMVAACCAAEPVHQVDVLYSAALHVYGDALLMRPDKAMRAKIAKELRRIAEGITR